MLDRFWNKVNKTSDCWIWTASRNKKKYGCFKLKGKTELAHRISWEIHNGTIPDGMSVCHHCDNPPCVRPDHLFLGTNKDNVNDRISKKRFVDFNWLKPYQQAGEKNPSSKLCQIDVDSIRKLYSDGLMTRKELGLRYNVTRCCIDNIINKKSWCK
jgi:HNH endonuclease